MENLRIFKVFFFASSKCDFHFSPSKLHFSHFFFFVRESFSFFFCIHTPHTSITGKVSVCTRCYHYLCKYINNGEDLVTKIIAKNDEIMLTASVSLNVMRWKYFSILNKFSKTVKRGNVHDDLTALVTMIKLKQTISIWLNYRKQILSLENSWKIFFFFFFSDSISSLWTWDSMISILFFCLREKVFCVVMSLSS